MYLVIKSDDINNGIANLNHPIENDYQLHSFSFTNDVYNVNSNNYILPYEESAVTSNVQLTQQFANGSDLASDIQTKLAAISSGVVSCTYDTNTNTFTITNSVNFKLNFATYGDGACADLLGFNNANVDWTSSATSDYVANLIPFQSIFIDIKEDKTKSIYDQDYGHHSFVINASSNFGDICKYIGVINDFTPQLIHVDKTKRLNINFYNQNNQSITLNNWCLILKKH